MTKTISIPFSDEQAQQIIQTWLDGPCGRVWCRRAVQDEYQDTRWHLTLSRDGHDAYHDGEDPLGPGADIGSVVDLIPQGIREALARMLTEFPDTEERVIAARALMGPTHVYAAQADAIVQVAIFGRVVFG